VRNNNLGGGRHALELLGIVSAQLEAKPAVEAHYVRTRWLVFGPAIWRARLEGVDVEIEREVIATPMAGLLGISHTVTVNADTGESITCTFSEGPSASPDVRRLINLWKSSRAEANDEVESDLLTIGSEAPRIWTFVDFLYFSVVTQTTVGYGDILPNSRRVRGVVSLQILLGYALLVVVINLVISSSGG
jgi:hypothetical protein